MGEGSKGGSCDSFPSWWLTGVRRDHITVSNPGWVRGVRRDHVIVFHAQVCLKRRGGNDQIWPKPDECVSTFDHNAEKNMIYSRLIISTLNTLNNALCTLNI